MSKDFCRMWLLRFSTGRSSGVPDPAVWPAEKTTETNIHWSFERYHWPKVPVFPIATKQVHEQCHACSPKIHALSHDTREQCDTFQTFMSIALRRAAGIPFPFGIQAQEAIPSLTVSCQIVQHKKFMHRLSSPDSHHLNATVVFISLRSNRGHRRS